MKSLVLLTFLNLSPGGTPVIGPAEFFDDRGTCEERMAELRKNPPTLGGRRCTCHETVEEVAADGAEAI